MAQLVEQLFQLQRLVVQIQSSANLLLIVEQTKMSKKRLGRANLKHPIFARSVKGKLNEKRFCQFLTLQIQISTKIQSTNCGSACGSDVRSVASDTRGPRFGIQSSANLFTVNCIEKTNIKRP